MIIGIGNAARLLSILSLWLTASLASTPALANPIAGCSAASSVIATPIGLPILEVPFLTTYPKSKLFLGVATISGRGLAKL